MQIYQINVLNYEMIEIQYANVSKLHEYYNKFDRKSLIKIFYFIDWWGLLRANVRRRSKPRRRWGVVET